MFWIRQGFGFRGSGFRVNQLTNSSLIGVSMRTLVLRRALGFGFGEMRACRVQSLRPTGFGEEGWAVFCSGKGLRAFAGSFPNAATFDYHQQIPKRT